MTAVHFLSWIRTGLSAGIPATAAAPLDAGGPVATTLPISLTFAGPGGASARNATVGARLPGPGDVRGLDPSAILRVYPAADSRTAERSWFAFVEFADAEMPWAYATTSAQRDDPAASNARRGLQPWLTLVVVPEAAAQFTPATQTDLAVLQVDGGLLPDLSASWLWTHAQVVTPAPGDSVATVLAGDPSSGLSRALCPIRLRPDTSYRAALVPTTDAGVAAGLGQPPPADDQVLQPAWHAGSRGEVVLPVYFSWTFAVGEDSDVRGLVDRLQPFTAATVGVRPLDVGHAGGGMPGPAPGDDPWLIDLEGALVSSQVRPGLWTDSAVQDQIENALTARLAAGGDTLRPPLYGGPQVGQSTIPHGAGWLRTLNLDPRYRTVAGNGARLVRAEQEALMTAAWEQVGQLDTANQTLNSAQLARAVGSSTYSTAFVSALDDSRLLQLTAGAHGDIAAASTAPRSSASVTAAAGPGSPDSAEAGAPGPTVAQTLGANRSAWAATSVAFRRLAQRTGQLAVRAGAPLDLLPRVAEPAAGGARVVPALTPLSGTVTPPGLTPSGSAAVTLRGLTAAVVDQPRLPWENPPATAATTTTRDRLLAPGYLSDVWIYPSALGSLTDWDGKPIWGWRGQTPQPHDLPEAIGPVAIYRFDAPDESPYPATAQAAVDSSLTQWGVYNSWSLAVTPSCTLRSDLIPGMADRGPIRAVLNSSNIPTWPTVAVGPTLRYGGNASSGHSWPDSTVPQVNWSAAVAAADLDGTALPSVVMAYVIRVSNEVDGSPTTQLTRGLTVLTHIYQSMDGSLATAGTVQATLPAVDGPVQSLAIIAGRLYLLINRRLFNATVTATSVGGWTELPGWDDALPADWETAAIAAADYTGDGFGDLCVYFSQRVPSAPGSTALVGGMRIRDVAPSDGSLGAWTSQIEVTAPLDTGQASLLYAAMTDGTAMMRQTATAAFRTAAATVQAEIAPRVPAAAPALPPSVGLADLATTVRAAIDPMSTIPAAVLGRIDAGVDLAGQADPIATLLITPKFPEPMSDRLLLAGTGQLVPGTSTFPDNSICVLKSNSATVEAAFAGANTEFGRALRWRQFPANPNGTYFRTFWAGPDNTGSLPDVPDMSTWTPLSSQLGSHAASLADVRNMTVVIIRGQVIRQLADLHIYSAPAVRSADGKRTVDLGHPTDPLFTGNLGSDTRLIAFGFDIGSARGDTDGLGRYLVFQERATTSRFGFDESATDPPTDFGPPTTWRSATWAQVAGDQASYDSLVYADGLAARLRALSLPDTAGPPQHRWGFSASDMAHISARPSALIVRHFSVYLPGAE